CTSPQTCGGGGTANVCGSASSTSSFITRSGSQLRLNGSQFRFGGMNMQWLGWNSSKNWPNGGYTSHAEAGAILSTVRSMNDRVIRSYGLMCVGANPGSLQTSLTTFDDSPFETIDYQLSVAPSYGIHFNFPLVTNWQSEFGGKHVYTDWRGITDENQFYYNATVIQDFKLHIAHILNHVNQYTG